VNLMKTVVFVLLGLVVVGGVFVTKWVLLNLFGEIFRDARRRGWWH
jgi:hypothetical protein